ncbi:MAG: O-antigen ligase family protein [Anaerolineae bacterium]|nr:O-antigen ligase family protein [Anaerolineae bacterium]
MSVSRARWARRLLWVSRVAFAASALLAMMTPAWEEGTFTHLPLATFRLSGQRFSVGALAFLPGISVAAWVAARLAAGRTWGWRWGPPHIAVPVFGFAVLAAIRIWPIHIQHTAVVTAVSLVLFVGAYLYALQTYSLAQATWLLAALLALQGGIAVLQFLRQGAIGLSWLGELPLDPHGQGVSVIEAAGQRWLRAYGMTPHPNVLGGYLSMCALVCLGALLGGAGRGRRWLWAALVAGGLGLFCTFSRSAWLGAAVGVAYLVVVTRLWRAVDWRAPRTRRQLAIGTALLVVAGAVLGILYGELLVTRVFRLGSPLEATSIQERLVDYAQAWRLIRTVPLKGTGSGYYIGALWAGVGEDRPPGFRRVHSTPLLAAAELGIGGAVLWLWMLLAPAAALARRSARAGVPAERAAAGWAAAMLVAAVLGLFDSYLYVPSTWWPALFLGIVAGAWARAWTAAQGGEEGQ